MSKEKFSLKDELFNLSKVTHLASEIKEVYPSFEADSFISDVVEKFSELELKERIYHIRDMLCKYLPNSYKEALSIVLKALPQELDNSKTDDDFGDFIYAPYSDFVATYGCSKEYLDISLNALREITKRFSVEFAIRDFINKYPKETFAMLEECAKSANYHERRLASEGLRPKLPWAKKIDIDYRKPISILDLLYTDKTRYVTRSVANHLNDISKIDSSLVLNTLKRWRSSNMQSSLEMSYIINHSLRTLVKQGSKDALEFLGYSKEPAINLRYVNINTPIVKIGQSLEFELEIQAQESVGLIVDYIVHYRSKNSKLSAKVHKLKKFNIAKEEAIVLKKKHLFRANMSTRKLYAGEHLLEIQINGTVVHKVGFILKEEDEL